MNTKTLHKKTDRYLCGASMPAETRQIQNWLSCTNDNKSTVPQDEKTRIENEILVEIQAYTAYPLLYPKPEPWWQKFTAFF